MNPIEKRIAEVFNQLGIESKQPSPAIAEKVILLCQIKGLTVEDIMQGRNPHGIAEQWMHRRLLPTKAVNKENREEGRHFPLLPFSKLVHNAILQDKEACDYWTFPILLRAKGCEVDAEKLSAAVRTATDNHPVFSMHITEDGKHWYEKGYRTPYLAYEVYYEGNYVYLSISINRILGDSTSFVRFVQNIWRAYRGETLPHDGYLDYLQQHEEHSKTKIYAEHGKWLAKQFANPTYPLLPTPDSPDGKLSTREYHPHVVTPYYADKLPELLRREKISINAFFCLVTALAIMDYNGTDEAGLTWAYMGRETKEQMNIFGSLHRDIPLVISRNKKNLFAQLKEQMEQGILYSDYPFTLCSPTNSPWHSAVNVLAQPNIAEAMEGCPVNFEYIPVKNSSESYCMLDININQEPLTLTFNYSSRHYTEESVCKFIDLIDQNTRMLLNL